MRCAAASRSPVPIASSMRSRPSAAAPSASSRNRRRAKSRRRSRFTSLSASRARIELAARDAEPREQARQAREGGRRARGGDGGGAGGGSRRLGVGGVGVVVGGGVVIGVVSVIVVVSVAVVVSVVSLDSVVGVSVSVIGVGGTDAREHARNDGIGLGAQCAPRALGVHGGAELVEVELGIALQRGDDDGLVVDAQRTARAVALAVLAALRGVPVGEQALDGGHVEAREHAGVGVGVGVGVGGVEPTAVCAGRAATWRRRRRRRRGGGGRRMRLRLLLRLFFLLLRGLCGGGGGGGGGVAQRERTNAVRPHRDEIETDAKDVGGVAHRRDAVLQARQSDARAQVARLALRHRCETCA